jgi:hypothetical protein
MVRVAYTGPSKDQSARPLQVIYSQTLTGPFPRGSPGVFQ